jgi:hypothetical protein
MKKSFVLILFSLSILCFCDNSKKRKKREFFYSKIKPEIYSIYNEKKMIVYNILDSTVNRYNINKNNFFNKTNNESFFVSTKEDTLILTKFHFKNINLEELKSTKWSLNFKENKQEIEQIIKINETGDMFLSQKDSEELFIPFDGFLFKKFYSYKFNSIILLVNNTDNKIELLNINYFNNRVKKYSFKKIR